MKLQTILETLQLLCENKTNAVFKRYRQKILDRMQEEYGEDSEDDIEITPEEKLQYVRLQLVGVNEKYLEWIIKQWVNGLMLLSEDIQQVKDDLVIFDEYKNKMQYKDINRYTLSTLRQELARFDQSGEDGEFAEELKQAVASNDIKFIEKNDRFVIYQALTKQGNIVLGKGGGHKRNRWCTARTDEKNAFDSYNEYTDIYVAIFDDGKRFQFDVLRDDKTVQNCMDELDLSLFDEESEFCDYWLEIRKSDLLQKNYHDRLEQSWEYDELMLTFEEFAKLTIKTNNNIIPSTNGSNSFLRHLPITIKVLLLMDNTRLLAQLQMLQIWCDRYPPNWIEDMQIYNIIFANKQLATKVYQAVNQSGQPASSYGEIISRLYQLGAT